MQDLIIGIDPGTNTGIAVIQEGKYTYIDTRSITEAIEFIASVRNQIKALYIENPKLRKWFGDRAAQQVQGAGSIKRDYNIWVEYLDRYKIPYVPLDPKVIGSQFDNEIVFKAATGWTKRTSKHARDAARMIYNNYRP